MGIVFKEFGTHHGRKRQSHHTRDNDRARQGQCKLGEQSTGAPRRERQGGKNRDKRHGHGDHSKTNFSHALDGSGKRLHTLFDIAVNVLQNHDGVVDHQANRQDQRQQGE